jgi:hypothetical protein
VIDLGPSSRVLLKPRSPAAKGVDRALIHVLDGWVKLSHPGATQAAQAVLASPWADLSKVAGHVVLHVRGPDLELFAESGSVAGLLRKPGGTTAPFEFESGAYLARQPDGQELVAARPAEACVQAVPRAFRDTLPARAEQMRSMDVQPGRGSRISYADVEGGLNAELRVRTRWGAVGRPVGRPTSLLTSSRPLASCRSQASAIPLAAARFILRGLFASPMRLVKALRAWR